MIIQLCTCFTGCHRACGLVSCQVVNDRMTAIRNENEDLRSSAVIADETYQKVLAEKGMLDMDLNRTKNENSHLMQQVCCCCISGILENYLFHKFFPS